MLFLKENNMIDYRITKLNNATIYSKCVTISLPVDKDNLLSRAYLDPDEVLCNQSLYYHWGSLVQIDNNKYRSKSITIEGNSPEELENNVQSFELKTSKLLESIRENNAITEVNKLINEYGIDLIIDTANKMRKND
jgi:hypothetical protein